MNQPIRLQKPSIPKMMGSLIHKNELLKYFAIISTLTCLVSVTLLRTVATKPPIVIPLASTGEFFTEGAMPTPESEIKKAVSAYLDLRYKWEPKNVEEKLKNAESFIAPQSLKAFRTQIANVTRFSKEKLVTQKIYAGDLAVDLANRKVSVFGDRITSIQGLKATGDLNLELEYQFGDRTKENPWGVFITKEKEGNQ